MPIRNISKGFILPQKVLIADKMQGRMIGLLGSNEPDKTKIVYFTPSSGIHSFGMKYSIDVALLDRAGYVIKIFRNFSPNRITGFVSKAHSAIESYVNAFDGLNVGDQLEVEPDGSLEYNLQGIMSFLHWPINIILALFWSSFIASSYRIWDSNKGSVSLGLIFVNTLLFILFLTRRNSHATSYRIQDWIIPVITIIISLTLQAQSATNLTIKYLSNTIQLTGVLAILMSLLSLGRSFGIVPANRNVKIKGAYKFMRHPLYASELTFYFGFLIGNINLYNTAAVFAILIAQLWRMGAEEKLLINDENYRNYLNQVRYKLIPGIF